MTWSYKGPAYHEGLETAETVEPSRGGGRLRKTVRRLGMAIAIVGVLLLGWATYVYFFGDPVTALYTDWRQRQLSGQLDREFKEFAPPVPILTPKSKRPSPEAIRAAARRFSRQIETGKPIGRIVIRRIHQNKVVVNGTGTGDLRKGPGRYPEGSWPGLGKVTAIAGHRTTYGAPFRHINKLQLGDLVRLELPYGTFTYRVFAEKIVDDEDWSVLDKRGFDMLVLSACHPIYNASQRWIVFARLASVAAPEPA